MPARNRRGFTLIELLVVIAIIAIVAAILFPVFGTIKENGRNATCISNMHELYVKAEVYRLDRGEYPVTLLGVAERTDGMPWTPADGTPVRAGQVQHGGLYPAFIKDVGFFHCPDDLDDVATKVVVASAPASSPWAAALQGAVGKDSPTFGVGPYPFPKLPASYATKDVYFYAMDSYDISSYLLADGTRKSVAGGPAYEFHYSRDWTAARARGIDTKTDSTNQLQYSRSFPPDRTILTWCNYHVTTAHRDMCPVLFASGTAKQTNYKLMVERGWNIGG